MAQLQENQQDFEASCSDSGGPGPATEAEDDQSCGPVFKFRINTAGDPLVSSDLKNEVEKSSVLDLF